MFYINFRDKIISQFMVFLIDQVLVSEKVLKLNKNSVLTSPSQFGPDLQSG